jgi:hypothetical protein
MTLIIGGVQLEDLLSGVGIHSDLIGGFVAFLGLVGIIGGGVKVALGLISWVRGRLRARKGDGPRRLHRRRVFAGFVESRIRDLDNKEEWSDHRFAELEAEVETRGVPRSRLLGTNRGLRREHSLSKALMRSKQQLILLFGDPGSGKSVALRFVARKMAAKATNSKRLDAVIPLYVNLKGLQRQDRPIDARLIEEFVLDSLRAGATADVDRFLEAEFENGKLEGSWFFLFDSFDEIPELLSSTDIDTAVEAYSDAIFTFIHGVSACRGVIASRHFRSPRSYGLPTFTIVPLSERRRWQLIDKADLDPSATELLDGMPAANPELVARSENPLFLGLLVEYVREFGILPKGWYDVFEAFVSKRIASHQDRLRHDFGLGPEELRLRSEEIAFTMTATTGLGLSPRRSELRRAYEETGFQHAGQLEQAMNALQWTKLARSEESGTSAVDPTFTFAHRRFQEYFATRVVLREPGRVTPERLLTDASWRETAVTLCQAQPENIGPIVAAAEAILGPAAIARKGGEIGSFTWEPGVLHVLGLLQSAFAGDTASLPRELREMIAKLLLEATDQGTITDQKWALEVAGTVPPDEMAKMLLAGFKGKSGWMREVAYRQAARLPEIPDEIAIEIRRALVGLAASRQLRRQWRTTKAQVLRLPPSASFLASARVLRIAPMVDLIVCAAGTLVILMLLEPSVVGGIALVVVAIPVHWSYYDFIATISQGSPLFRRRNPAMGSWGLGSFKFLGFLMMILLVEFRIAAPTVPVLLAAHNGQMGYVALGLLWIYALNWSLAASAQTVRRPPTTLAGWIVAPLRFIPRLGAALRKTTLPMVGIAIVALLVGGAFFFGLSQLPEGVGEIIFIPVAGLMGLAALGVFVRLAVIDLLGMIWVWRWSKRHGAQISSTEFLKAVSSIPGNRGISEFVSAVRVERLLREDVEAEAMVRDLLFASQRKWKRSNQEEDEAEAAKQPPASAWGSPAFAAWESENGVVLRRLCRDGIEDLLGQLLEDLGQEEEIPVA